jgi:putative FmdB family regulatory protein
MPIYEYECERDGAFELERPMSQSSEPAACPACAESSRRILSLPRLTSLPRASLVAHATNERSRHEPKVVRRSDSPGSVARAPAARPALRGGGGYPWALGH